MIDTILFICNITLLIPAVGTLRGPRIPVRGPVGLAAPLSVMAVCFAYVGLAATAAVVGVTAGIWWAVAVKALRSQSTSVDVTKEE